MSNRKICQFKYFLFILACLFLSYAARAETLTGLSGSVSITTTKVSHIVGEINSDMYFKFATEMALTSSIPGDRIVIISSPGGRVDVGEAILQLLQFEQSAGVKLRCVVVGDASSMAFNIFTHCDTRLATWGSHFLVHKVESGGWNPEIRLTARNARRLARYLDKLDAPFAIVNAAAMGMTLEEYGAYADKETTWDVVSLMYRHYLNDVGVVSQ